MNFFWGKKCSSIKEKEQCLMKICADEWIPAVVVKVDKQKYDLRIDDYERYGVSKYVVGVSKELVKRMEKVDRSTNLLKTPTVRPPTLRMSGTKNKNGNDMVRVIARHKLSKENSSTGFSLSNNSPFFEKVVDYNQPTPLGSIGHSDDDLHLSWENAVTRRSVRQSIVTAKCATKDLFLENRAGGHMERPSMDMGRSLTNSDYDCKEEDEDEEMRSNDSLQSSSNSTFRISRQNSKQMPLEKKGSSMLVLTRYKPSPDNSRSTTREPSVIDILETVDARLTNRGDHVLSDDDEELIKMPSQTIFAPSMKRFMKQHTMRSESMPAFGPGGQTSHSEWDEFFESTSTEDSPFKKDHRTRESILSAYSFGLAPTHTDSSANWRSDRASMSFHPESIVQVGRKISAAENFVTNFDSKISSGSLESEERRMLVTVVKKSGTVLTSVDLNVKLRFFAKWLDEGENSRLNGYVTRFSYKGNTFDSKHMKNLTLDELLGSDVDCEKQALTIFIGPVSGLISYKLLLTNRLNLDKTIMRTGNCTENPIIVKSCSPCGNSARSSFRLISPRIPRRRSCGDSKDFDNFSVIALADI